MKMGTTCNSIGNVQSNFFLYCIGNETVENAQLVQTKKLVRVYGQCDAQKCIRNICNTRRYQETNIFDE